MTFIELRDEFARAVQEPDTIRAAPSLFAFAQDALEQKFHPPALEKTVSAYIGTNTNAIAVPADYLEIVYLQATDGVRFRMLQPFGEQTFAQHHAMKGLSAIWAPNAVMSLGTVLIPTVGAANGLAYQVTTAGTSGVTEPTWPATLAATVAKDGVTYTAITLLNSGFPSSYDRVGPNWLLNIPVDQQYLFNIRYYAAQAKLKNDGDTNIWTLTNPELLLYGALVKAIPYLGDDPRGAAWAANYKVLCDDYRTALGRERYAGKKRQTSTHHYYV